MNKRRAFSRLLFLSATALMVAACGGGGQTASGGTGGTGMVAVSRGPVTQTAAAGVMTGVTSRATKTTVMVNGVAYQTVGAGVDMPDGHHVDQDGSSGGTMLFAGMVVTVHGTINADLVTGSATTITYAPSLRGQISNMVMPTATTATFTLYGQSVVVDLATTYFQQAGAAGGTLSATLPAWLTAGSYVEVSGFVQPNGQLVATFVKEVAANGTVQIEGIITSINAATSTFTIGSTTITVPSTVAFDWTTAMAGLQVMITATDPANPAATQLTATSVVTESSVPGAQEGDTLEVTDVVSYVDPYSSTLQLGAQLVTYNANTVFKNGTVADLKKDAHVEVEGPLSGGKLLAKEIHFQ